MSYDALHFVKLLANDLRWQMITHLSQGDHRVNELVSRVQQPANLVSYHLRQLRDANLVIARRSEADGRDTYYQLNLDQMKAQFAHAGAAIHPALMMDTVRRQITDAAPLRILILCTHNSARSQMAEGLLRHLAADRVQVFSAGSHPTKIRSEAITVMSEMGIDIRHQTVNHISEYIEQEFDYVITVCDYAREFCPTFEGGGRQLHWGYNDPSQIDDPEQRLREFRVIAQQLKTRFEYFLATLP